MDGLKLSATEGVHLFSLSKAVQRGKINAWALSEQYSIHNSFICCKIPAESTNSLGEDPNHSRKINPGDQVCCRHR